MNAIYEELRQRLIETYDLGDRQVRIGVGDKPGLYIKAGDEIRQNIRISIESGRLAWHITTRGYGLPKEIKIPAFEDPKFDPELVIEAVLTMVEILIDLAGYYREYEKKHDLALSAICGSFERITNAADPSHTS